MGAILILNSTCFIFIGFKEQDFRSLKDKKARMLCNILALIIIFMLI